MISFQVLTPEGILLQEEVVSILLPAVNGPLLIEGGYTPTIVECLPSGVVKIDFGNKVKYYAEFHGVGRVTPEGTFLFCAELFEDGYEIDMARAIASRDRNLDLIQSQDPNVDVAYAQISLNKQLARIQAKTLGEGQKEL